MIKRTLVSSVLLLALATSANAAPIHFDISGVNSSVSASGVSLCLGCSLSLTLNPVLDTQVFDLDVGQTFSFDFFDISATGIFGAMAGTVAATLAFDLPIVANASGTALAGATWLFGTGVGGLTFGVMGQPANVSFGNGGIFSVAFSSAYDTCRGRTFTGCTLNDTITATVTLLQAPGTTASVPEPNTLYLLGGGLLGFAVLYRRRRTAK